MGIVMPHGALCGRVVRGTSITPTTVVFQSVKNVVKHLFMLLVTIRGTTLPAELERRLKAEARKKFPKDKERQDRYVYGTLNKLKKKGVIAE